MARGPKVGNTPANLGEDMYVPLLPPLVQRASAGQDMRGLG